MARRVLGQHLAVAVAAPDSVATPVGRLSTMPAYEINALRHVTDLESTFREYLRVLKPGGTLLILELTRPAADSAAYRFTRFYLHTLVPLMARLGPGGPDMRTLMEYFWDTVDSCVPPSAILAALADSGFTAPRRGVMHQVFSEYVARKSPT